MLDVITPNETEAEVLAGIKVENVESADEFANKAASISVDRLDAQSSAPRLEELDGIEQKTMDGHFDVWISGYRYFVGGAGSDRF